MTTSSFMSTLIEWLVVTLIAGGAGFALAAMAPPAAQETPGGEKPAPVKLTV